MGHETLLAHGEGNFSRGTYLAAGVFSCDVQGLCMEEVFRESNVSQGNIYEECLGDVWIPTKDYKSLCAEVMILTMSHQKCQESQSGEFLKLKAYADDEAFESYFDKMDLFAVG